MTAEELAEIGRKLTGAHVNAHYTNGPAVYRDLKKLFGAFNEQAQRIAELEAQLEEVKSARDMNFDTCARLEAQLAARGPTREAIYTAIEEYCYVARDPKDDLSYIVAGKYQAADAILSSGALATAHTEKLQENSCPPRRCDSAGIGGEMGSLSPVATAQAVTLTEEERATVEYYRKSTWRTARKLLAIIDRLTGASTP